MSDFSAAREAMVDCQVRPSDVTRYAIIEAMLWAPRERFVPKARRAVAYAGAEIPLAPGRALLEPRTFAKMLESAQVGPEDLVLDLAPGTGYSSAVIARIAQAVVAVEPDETLAKQAAALMGELEVDNCVVTPGDATAGDPAHGPYDVIFVNGMVQQLPKALGEQLKPGGRLVAIFTEGGSSQCRVLTRIGNGLSARAMFDATAPLVPGFGKATEFSF